MKQIDQLSQMLESAQVKPVRARPARRRSLGRRGLLFGGAALVGMGGLSIGGVAFARWISRPQDVVGTAAPSQAPAAVEDVSLPVGVLGGVVWTAPASDVVPVLAPGGTGAGLDADGRVQILDEDGLLVTSPDVTPEAVVVAGVSDGEDVIAWSTGKVVSWWTRSEGLQRVQHDHPVGLTAVGGGVLAFDDAEWSGRLDPGQLVGLPVASDAVTIGVLEDGSSVSATSDGILTRISADGEQRLVQPTVPADGLQVRRVAGLLGEWVVLVWDMAGADDEGREVTVSMQSVVSGSTAYVGSVPFAAVDGVRLVRAGRGAVFGRTWMSRDGAAGELPDGTVASGSAGDYVIVSSGDEEAWMDPTDGDVREPDPAGVWTRSLAAGRVSWVGDADRIWFVKEEG